MKKEKDLKTRVQAVRMTEAIYQCLTKEAKEEGRRISRMMTMILEERYKNQVCEFAVSSDSKNDGEEDNRICYPLDHIVGRPLRAYNKVWYKGEIITYGDIVHRIYKNHKVRIAKADLKGIPLDQIIKEIENEG